MAENRLYYGDNLDVLRRYVKDESVDLVYLDPPFNSRQDYNVLFAEKDGTRSASQIMVFEDTWEWNQESARTYEQVVEEGGRVAQVMIASHLPWWQRHDGLPCDDGTKIDTAAPCFERNRFDLSAL